MIDDQQRYEIRKIQLDARDIAAQGGYPLTVALAMLAGVRINNVRDKVVKVAIETEVESLSTVTVTKLATDPDGQIICDPGFNPKRTWTRSEFDDRPQNE